MPLWLGETKVIRPVPNGKKLILFLDSCSVQNRTTELIYALEKINTTLRYFPKKATHLVQPADFFVIQKIKTAYSSR